MNVVEQCEGDFFDFILRETTTAEIIDDVRSFRSEVGILYLDAFNQRVMQKAFDDADVSFYRCSTRACMCSWARTTRWPDATSSSPRS